MTVAHERRKQLTKLKVKAEKATEENGQIYEGCHVHVEINYFGYQFALFNKKCEITYCHLCFFVIYIFVHFWNSEGNSGFNNFFGKILGE